MRALIRRLHQAFGLVIALYLILMALTGTVLTFRDDILRLAVPGLDAPATTVTQETLDTIVAAYGADGLRTIKLPHDGMNAFRLFLPDHREQLIDPATLAPVHDPLHADAFLVTLFDLHHRLAMGEAGEALIGIMGLTALVLALTGLWLWWPWRKGFALKRLKAKGPSAAAARGSHATTGILMLPLLLLSVTTGSAMIYSTPVRDALIAIWGGDRPVTETARGETGYLAAAQAALPAARPVFYILPKTEDAAPSLRLKMPAEWHPNGRSTVAFGEGGSVTTLDATASDAGHRAADAIYPLHAGKVGGLAYRLLVALTGLGILYLAVMGLLAFTRRYRRLPRPSSPAGGRKPSSGTV